MTVNVNESLQKIEITPMEKEFASVFYPFDSNLTLLLRRLLCLQENRFVFQAKEMVQRYPWLEGALYIETRGGQEEKRITTLKESVQKINIYKIEKLYPREDTGEAYLVENISGRKKLLLIKKENKGKNVSSYMILILNLSSLKQNMFPKTNHSIAVVGAGKILISEGISSKVLLKDFRWQQLLSKGSRGRVRVGSSNYFWMMRYIGDIPLFYIVGG